MESYPEDNAKEGYSELKKAWEAYQNGLYRRAALKGVNASFYLSEEVVAGDYDLLDAFHEAGMLTLVSSALYAEYAYDEIDRFILDDYKKVGFEPPVHAVNDARESAINQIMDGPEPILSAIFACQHADIIGLTDSEKARALKYQIVGRAFDIFYSIPADHPNYFLYQTCAEEWQEILDELNDS